MAEEGKSDVILTVLQKNGVEREYVVPKHREEAAMEAEISEIERKIVHNYVREIAHNMCMPVRQVKERMAPLFTTIEELHTSGTKITRGTLHREIGKPPEMALDLLIESGEKANLLIMKINLINWVKRLMILSVVSMVVLFMVWLIATFFLVSSNVRGIVGASPIAYSEMTSTDGTPNTTIK